MNGSEPPSSSTCFLSAAPAWEATMAPTSVEPVRVTAAIRSSAMMPATCAASIRRVAEQPCGHTRPAEDLLDGECALRHIVGVLEDRAVAGGERGGDEAEELPERVVPRHDRENDAERVEARSRFRRRSSRCVRRQEPLGVLGVEVAGHARTSRSRPRIRRMGLPISGVISAGIAFAVRAQSSAAIAVSTLTRSAMGLCANRAAPRQRR